MTTPTSTCLWLESGAAEAAAFYQTLFPDARVTHTQPKFDNPDEALVVSLEIGGQKFSLLNGGPYYKLSPAASIEVKLDTQADIDRVWAGLSEGGTEMQCGWLTDRWGVSWQIVPKVFFDLIAGPKADAVMAAMMQMVKFDIAALEAAAE